MNANALVEFWACVNNKSGGQPKLTEHPEVDCGNGQKVILIRYNDPDSVVIRSSTDTVFTLSKDGLIFGQDALSCIPSSTDPEGYVVTALRAPVHFSYASCVDLTANLASIRYGWKSISALCRSGEGAPSNVNLAVSCNVEDIAPPP